MYATATSGLGPNWLCPVQFRHSSNSTFLHPFWNPFLRIAFNFRSGISSGSVSQHLSFTFQQVWLTENIASLFPFSNSSSEMGWIYHINCWLHSSWNIQLVHLVITDKLFASNEPELHIRVKGKCLEWDRLQAGMFIPLPDSSLWLGADKEALRQVSQIAVSLDNRKISNFQTSSCSYWVWASWSP